MFPVNNQLYNRPRRYRRQMKGGRNMGTKVSKEKITREPGYLYYVGKDGYVWKTPMKVNKKGKKAKVGTEKITRKPGCMYYLDKVGFVCQAKMKNA